MAPPHTEAGREERLLRRTRPSAHTSAPLPQLRGAMRDGGHRATAPPLPLPLWRASPSGSSTDPTRGAAPASLASIPLLLPRAPAGGGLHGPGGRRARLGSSAPAPHLHPPSSLPLRGGPGARAAKARGRPSSAPPRPGHGCGGLEAGRSTPPGAGAARGHGAEVEAAPGEGPRAPLCSVLCPKPWRSRRWARPGPACAAGLLPPHRRARRLLVGGTKWWAIRTRSPMSRRAGGGARRPASGIADHGGGARRTEMEWRERGRKKRSRWEKTKIYRGIFANICQCGNTWHATSAFGRLCGTFGTSDETLNRV